MKPSLPNIYIPGPNDIEFYYMKEDQLLRTCILLSTRTASPIKFSSFYCTGELRIKLIDHDISYNTTTAANPEEFISLHPELFI